MTIKRFEELECWKIARELSKYIFHLTQKDHFSRDYKHVDQINSSSGSVMDNVAEGFGRRGNREFSYFLHISLGSCYEVKSQLFRAIDKHYINDDEFTKGMTLADNTAAKVFSLIKSIKESQLRGPKYK